MERIRSRVARPQGSAQGCALTAHAIDMTGSIQKKFSPISGLTLILGLLKLERVMGIEPTLSAWEAEVLPLNYTRKFLQKPELYHNVNQG